MAQSSTSSRKRRPSWLEREIIYESNINLEELRSHPMAQRTLRILHDSHLLPLMTPAPIAYPRVVREFYQHLGYETNDDDELRISIRIDRDFNASFGVREIAAALGLAGYDSRPVNRVDPPDEFSMVQGLLEGRGAGTVVRRSYLHPSMWLFDHIFIRNICPVGHAQERRPPVLRYLYAAYHGHFVDVAELILTTFVRIFQDGRATPFGLAYPRFITTLLEFLGYRPSDTEERVIQFETFGTATWDLSLQRLKSLMNYQEDDDAPQAPPRQPRRAPAAEPAFQWTQQMYDDMMAGQAEVRQQQTAMFEQQATIMQQQSAMFEQQTTILQQQQYLSSDLYSLRQDFYEQQSIMESVAGMTLGPETAQRVFTRARHARGRAQPRGYQPPKEL